MIRAAQKWQKRPTAAIMRDDWFGHRNPLTGKPLGDRDEFTAWDHALIGAFQTIEDYTDEYGLLAWEREDPQVAINANRKIHPFKEALEMKTKGTDKKPYKARPGEYFVPEVISQRSDGSIQTMREWIEREIEKESN